jgi:hypothetical protein
VASSFRCCIPQAVLREQGNFRLEGASNETLFEGSRRRRRGRGQGVSVDHVNIVRAGINYKFGGF